MDWHDNTVFRITGPDITGNPQGTGFLVWQEGQESLVVTCWHVVNSIGKERLKIGKFSCELVSRELGEDGKNLDLAVLKVVGLPESTPLQLARHGQQGKSFLVYGYGPEGRPLSGNLGEQTRWEYFGANLDYWDYYLDEQSRHFETVRDGYSGSPVYDPISQRVIAVVTHRAGSDKGHAIDIRELVRVYPQASSWLSEPVLQSPCDIPEHSAFPPVPQSPRKAPLIRQKALGKITDILTSLPLLREALSREITVQAEDGSADLAERLCPLDADELVAVLESFRYALDKVQQEIAHGRGDGASLREDARNILGWMVVTTVLDGYDQEDTQEVRALMDAEKIAFHLPFERSPVIEVLSSCWLQRQARFGVSGDPLGAGEDDLLDRPLGEPGFNLPVESGAQRVVDTLWKLLHQKLWPGQPIPQRVTLEMRNRILVRMERKRRDKESPRWFRLVINSNDIHHSIFSPDVQRTIAQEIRLLQLIVVGVRQGDSGIPKIFLIPPSELAAEIDECLERIDSLSEIRTVHTGGEQ